MSVLLANYYRTSDILGVLGRWKAVVHDEALSTSPSNDDADCIMEEVESVVQGGGKFPEI